MTQKKPRLGVLALMLEDYLPLFPGIDRAQTAYVNEVLDGLRAAAEFVFPHAAMNRAQIESLVAQYNHEKLDGILILLLTYSQGAYLVRALEENHLPLALALIQPEQTVRPDFIEWDYTVNQGIHGSQDQANVMTRMGVNCVYYAGNRCDGSFVRFVADFGRAAMTVRAMKRMRIGVIGKLPGMGDVITDDMAIYRFLGPELVYDSIGTVRRFCAEVEEDAVRAQMEADRAVFELDPTLDEPTHAEAARMYLGLRAYLQSGGLSGYTLHYGECGEDGRFTQLPLLAASNLLADGYGYAAEGDSTAAVLVAAMQTLCGAAGFTEMYMMDFKREAILMCHQGEGNWRLCRADRRPYLKNRVLSEGGLSNPPTPIFTPEPGRACILSLTHLTADRFRLVCAPGEILPDADLLHVDMPYLFFRPDSGVRSCVTAWLEQGGTHHEALVLGDRLDRIRLFCRLWNVEFVQL